MGLYVRTEVRIATGCVGATVELDTGVWIFEFKLDGNADVALAQIREKDYPAPCVTCESPFVRSR
uniref:PD-(D/E)XK nuclease superfamily protein n=1 Tax=Candidatus Kentrum sp. TC TaxID=2126339 RepID=A0A450ZXJ7_9GAMM|nr:MAG: PD-(D/E)XK nuclease superfamily protein [Candidatus Kentron sp. TC]